MDTSNTWQKTLDLIKLKISPGNFRTWFSQTGLGEINEEKIILKAPSAFIKGQLMLRYDSLIKESLEKTVGKNPNLEYQVDPSLDQKKVNIPQDQNEEFEFSSPSIPQAANPLNPKYTLENFMVGLTNNLAYAAAQAVVANPGISYNPLYIYGPSGVGKTHLMQAIGHAMLKKNPSAKLIYAPSEKFMNDLVYSIQSKTTQSFRTKYRSVDILLIDDIQFISGKDSTQEEFFHTFNELHSKNSQLVFTSDRPPHEIQKLESRLQSRFQGGLMVDIQLPDFDTRVAILKAKLAERGETLPEEYLKMIAEVALSSTRELEGKLIQILQIIKLNGKVPTEELIKKSLGKTLLPTTQSVDHRKVLAVINQYFNVKLADLVGPRRQKGLVFPRQIAMFLLYENCSLPMEKIGEILGGRDHTTVLHGIEKIKAGINRDREVQRIVIEVKQNLSTG